MGIITFQSNLVLKDCILKNGYISVEQGKIVYVGREKPVCEQFEEYPNCYISPGFIDIHCHSDSKVWAYENPNEVADYHYKHGTTTMLLSFYRDLSHDKLVEAINKVKSIMPIHTNIYGIHLEGPYINCRQGAGKEAVQDCPDKSVYDDYINSGIIRQWTCAPEVDGVLDFIKYISDKGIVPAIGHSTASYQEVKKANEKGARITTHIFNANGTSRAETSFEGTLDMSFDEACMLMDNMYYEVICDKNWVHVRKEMLALLLKTVGIDKVIAITDNSKNISPGEEDITIENGELAGSRLTLNSVAENLKNAGYSLTDIGKITALNAAKVLGLNDRGELAVGKKADLILLDNKAKYIKTL